MQDKKVKEIFSAEQLCREIRARLLDGHWGPSRKLPTERALASEFSVARNTVRRALSQLEAQGEIERKVGQGTFLIDERDDPFSHATDVLAASSPSGMLELRLLLEPAAMEFVIPRTTQNDLKLLEKCLDRCEKAKSWQEFDEWDMAFHAAMMHTVRNDLLDQIFVLIRRSRKDLEWSVLERKGLTPERRAACDREHRRLLDSIRMRDIPAAKSAIHKHLTGVRAALLGY